MATYTQQERPIGVETPFGADMLLLNSFNGTEAISQLFNYTLNMSSPKPDLDPKTIVGKSVTFWVLHEDGEPQYFNGIVKRFTYQSTDDRLSYYQAEVVPWIWFLSQTSNCRIFQKMTIPDILKKVIVGGASSFNIKGVGDVWDYCVQYRETDFNFISRLMEQEGIFYFFKHANGKHEMVLANDKTAYKDVKDVEARYSANPDDPEIDNLSSWEHQYEFGSGKWSQTDYNFETPSTNLMTTTDTVLPINQQPKLEIYDYPGEYEKKPQGESYVRIRMEEEEAAHNTVLGTGSCRSFTPGGKFKLKTHLSPAEKGKGYVITAVRHDVSVGDTYITGGSEGASYNNSFVCIPDHLVFRPARVTPRPIIQGIQTAVVVGPAGEEIYTDNEGYGRIKVQFHWDRQGKKDENSSCWVRVATPWAGNKWGMIHIPRIGQEVIVQFLEGDPDRPLVIGSVYNAQQMPPYGLPANKTQSGIKSRSSKGGGEENFNEIRFEDKKGEEQVYIHAEKNQDNVVENDDTQSVGRDQTLDVGRDRKKTIGQDETTSVGRDRKESVSRDESIKIAGNRSEQVQKDETIVISGNRTENVGKNEQITIGEGRKESVGKNEELSIAENRQHNVGKKDQLTVGTELFIEAGDQITIRTGESSITMKKDGTIQIKGKDITVNGSGKINLKASSDVSIKGSSVKSN